MSPPTVSQPNRPDDPRTRKDFVEEFFPLANGKPAPSIDAAARNDQVMLEFLSVYYEINSAYATLLEARQKLDPSQRADAELESLRVIERHLIARDALEDHYAPCGLVAQPVSTGGFTTDIRFSFGNADSRGQPRTDLYRLAAEVPIPLPAGAKLEDYIVDFKGPEPFMPLLE